MIFESVWSAAIITDWFCDSIIFSSVIMICLKFKSWQWRKHWKGSGNSLEVFYRQLAVSIFNANHQIHEHLRHVLWIAVLDLWESDGLFDDFTFSEAFWKNSLDEIEWINGQTYSLKRLHCSRCGSCGWPFVPCSPTARCSRACSILLWLSIVSLIHWSSRLCRV